MHYKDYIHHGLAAEKTPPPLPQGGGNHLAGWGGGCGGPCNIKVKMDRKVSFQGSSKFNVFFLNFLLIRQALRRNEALVANFWELRRRADIYYAWSPSKNGRDHLQRFFFLGNRTKWRFIVGKINDKWWISQQAMFDDRRVGIRLKRGPRIVERWEVVKTRIDFTNIRGV